MIVPSFTFAATANAVAVTGATPVFVDIDPLYFALDPDAIEGGHLTADQGGHPGAPVRAPAAMPQINEIAESAGLRVLEDAAQAHAASLDGRPAGAWGDRRGLLLLPDEEHDVRGGRDGRDRLTPNWPAPYGCCATRGWRSGTTTSSRG